MHMHYNRVVKNSVVPNTRNPIQRDRTKHVEIDRHFIKQKLNARIISFTFVKSQLADLQTKAVASRVFLDSFVKLDMCDIYVPT